jgi:uncharacterized membrane protein YfcA
MENALGIILICILLILAIISTRIAKKKGRSSLAWFFITLLLAPGFLILLENHNRWLDTGYQRSSLRI